MNRFSEGFMHDLADLLEMCIKEKTDTIEIEFDINGKQLDVEISFSIKEGGVEE